MTASWKSLFAPAKSGGQAVGVRVFTRAGHPLLIVPRQGGLPARSVLGLYAPQTTLARLACNMWRLSLPLGFAPGSYVDAVDIDPSSPFLQFLSTFSGRNASNSDGSCFIPSFVILAGNPHAPAPRFLVQVFDQAKRPVAVVKTGIGPDAAKLIDREADFLEVAALEPRKQQLLAMPQVLGRFSHGDLRGFAMRFIEGTSPRPAQSGTISLILSSWIDRERRRPAVGLRAWERLAQASSGDERFRRLYMNLASLEVHPTLFHGDFVPWNIKVSPDKEWTVLDWERGEKEGPPGWDWFHYVIQSAVLVGKKSGSSLLQVAEEMLGCDSFRAYSAAVGLAGHERDWLRAYLFHCRAVLRPRDHAPEVDQTLARLIESL